MWETLFAAMPKLKKLGGTNVVKRTENGIWNGIRVWLAGTNVRKLGAWPFVGQIPIGDTAFFRMYAKIDMTECYKRLLKELNT